MIKSVHDDAVSLAIYRGELPRRLDVHVARRAKRKMNMIDSAGSLQDLRVPPSNRLEKLRGDRSGQYSIRVNDQFRICFRWNNGDAYDVEFVDYH